MRKVIEDRERVIKAWENLLLSMLEGNNKECWEMKFNCNISFGNDNPETMKMIETYCSDCNILIICLSGQKPPIKQYGLCDRCRAKRNGFIGAKDATDLGII